MWCNVITTGSVSACHGGYPGSIPVNFLSYYFDVNSYAERITKWSSQNMDFMLLMLVDFMLNFSSRIKVIMINKSNIGTSFKFLKKGLLVLLPFLFVPPAQSFL